MIYKETTNKKLSTLKIAIFEKLQNMTTFYNIKTYGKMKKKIKRKKKFYIFL